MSLDYYKANAGQLCDNENDVVRSHDECTTALKSLRYQISNFWTGTSNHYHNHIPVGCSIRESGDNQPHFLQSSTGLGTGRSDLIPICKRAKN